MPADRRPRKLLVAAIGVATINYLATACGKPPTSGNLPSPQPEPDAQVVPVAGNLPAPPPMDAAAPAPKPAPSASSSLPPGKK